MVHFLVSAAEKVNQKLKKQTASQVLQPGQGWVLQLSYSEVISTDETELSQAAPTIILEAFLVPLPHGSEHGVQSHALHSQTGGGGLGPGSGSGSSIGLHCSLS